MIYRISNREKKKSLGSKGRKSRVGWETINQLNFYFDFKIEMVFSLQSHDNNTTEISQNEIKFVVFHFQYFTDVSL